jgi:DNA repair protein RadC
MGIYHRGERFFEHVIRAYDPVDPYELSENDLLQIMGLSPKASLNLLERADGSLFNLSEVNVEELVDIDGVGKASAAKIIALFAYVHHYERWKQRVKN